MGALVDLKPQESACAFATYASQKKREITTATIRAEVYWDAEVSEERHAVGYEHIKYTQHDSTSTILLALFTLTHDSALSFLQEKEEGRRRWRQWG
jgi:hypothetical protein